MPRVLRWQSSTQAFIEPLAEGQALTMLRIPAGRFVMGSPEGEPERMGREGPQHQVEQQPDAAEQPTGGEGEPLPNRQGTAGRP